MQSKLSLEMILLRFYAHSHQFKLQLRDHGQDGLLGDPPPQIIVASNIAAAPEASLAATSHAAGATPATIFGDGAHVPTDGLARSPLI